MYMEPEGGEAAHGTSGGPARWHYVCMYVCMYGVCTLALQFQTADSDP